VSGVSTDETDWLSTQEAARRLGITPRTLYRFIDHGELPAYRFEFISRSRIQPGELEHLYPEPAVRGEVTADEA
jgi:excisionase family DNA binding protein